MSNDLGFFSKLGARTYINGKQRHLN